MRHWFWRHRKIFKQLGYGTVYLAILTGLSFGVYYFFLIPEPSCFDKIQNQNEESLDCGGPCIPCELKTLKLQISEAKVFSTSGSRSTIVAPITDPSLNFGLKEFDYEFQLFNSVDTLLAKLSGRSYISTTETKYLTMSGIDFKKADISKVVVNVPIQNWVTKDKLHIYNLKFAEVKTTPLATTVQVTGKLVNDSSASYGATTIISLLFNKKGDMINASTTKIDSVAAFSETPFTIFFPNLNVAEVNVVSTKVFYEINR